MQTKHLHLLLLILVAAGCGRGDFPADNPYVLNKKPLEISFDGETPAAMVVQGVDIRITGRSAPGFQARLAPHRREFWDVQWEDETGEPLRLPRRRGERTLVGLSAIDSSAGFVERIVPLPGGKGVAVFLEAEGQRAYGLTVTAPGPDSLWPRAPQKLSERLWLVTAADSQSVAVATSAEVTAVERSSAPGQAAAWRFKLAPSAEPQAFMGYGARPAEAVDRVIRWGGHAAERMERAVRDSLASRLAFSLQCSHEPSNQLFALLSAALVGANDALMLDTRPRIDDAAQMAAALWLADRAQPGLAMVPADETLLEQQLRDRLRWGSEAWRSTLIWGMAGPDTLKQLTLDVLAGLSRLQSEYNTADVEVVADGEIRDPLMRLAVAHVRYADLMALGEEICLARGDREAQGSFRREALRAGKKARQLLEQSARLYFRKEENPQLALESVLDTTSAPLDETVDEDATRPVAAPVLFYPDTALFLTAGARHGFNWLDEQPALLWNPQLAVGGYTWQRWVAWRFRSDLNLLDTPDLDSLTTLLMSGPVPGVLTAEPRFAGEPSLLVMAAAFRNLAEIYVGVRPDAMQRRLHIEPRLPANWGRTAARVPYRTGWVRLDYDFAHERATVELDGVDGETDVFFGYPLPNGGYLRTQFTLSPRDRAKTVALEHEKDGRLELNVEDVY